jgi:hypothetical protein
MRSFLLTSMNLLFNIFVPKQFEMKMFEEKVLDLIEN